MKRVIIISATDEVDGVLNLTLPKIKALAYKCKAELRLLGGLPKKYQHGKYRIFESAESVSDDPDDTRYLIMDADILTRDFAPDIFEVYPTGNWMLDEGNLRGHGFEAHRRELNRYLDEAKLPRCAWPKLHWWNPGVSLLSKDAVKAIFQMPPWDVHTHMHDVSNGKVVKNMPWINYRIAITKTEIHDIDIRWNTFPSTSQTVQREAYFWHCYCKEVEKDRTSSKVRMIHQMCKRFNESLAPVPPKIVVAPPPRYHVHFVCGRQTNRWILERMQEEIIKYAPSDIRISFSGVSLDEPKVINYYNPYRIYREKSKYALDVAFCTHPEIMDTWDKFVAEADHVICMCEQYKDMVSAKRKPGSVSLIYPGIDPEYYEHRLRIFNPVMMTGKPRKGINDWEFLKKIDWLICQCTDGKLTKEQVLACYLACDIVVSTSLLEGGPMLILEAAALGKLCFARKGVGFVDDFAKDFPNLHTYSTLMELVDLLQQAYLSKPKISWDLTWKKWADEHWSLFNRLSAQLKEYPNFTPKIIINPPIKRKLPWRRFQSKKRK